ncbi:MAG: BON domain-containing protein [Acidobacteria bacterium]|nr:BON domain-containing protein [Acidobacteriota bacterium]
MTSKFALLLAAFLIFQLVGVAAKQQPPVTDDTITDQVRLKLTSDPDVKGGALDVKVDKGVVTLSGGVETPKQRAKAEKLTRKVKGVKSVVNQIVIKQVPDR